jgi:SAM-dependent methyltransferase
MKVGACPGCGSNRTRDLGLIPRSNSFAGQIVASTPARLALCRDCRLGYRSPQPSRERLAELYAAGSETAWTIEDQERPDWHLAADRLREVGASSVLDVGCFDGAFFDLVDEGIERFGIEINPEAAQRAQHRGVDIVATDLHQLDELGKSFDCVVAFDVIEHVHDPAEFLAVLNRSVRVGGHVILATGDFSAPTRRLMGSRYLYSWYQEHIAFISPRWIVLQAPRLGFEVVQITRFSHHNLGLRGLVAGFAKNAAYRVAPSMVDRARIRVPSEGSAPSLPAPPAWTSAKDHFLVLLRKST